jgi:glucose-6-phosphate-specific signal transduction histidine kinase
VWSVFNRPCGRSRLVLSADTGGDHLPYAVIVIKAPVASLLAEPAIPDPPRRVWRDWVLAAVIVPSAVTEALLRPDLPWRWLSLIVCVGTVPALFWRRTHPLLATVLTFGTYSVVTLAALGFTDEPIGLVTTAFCLIIPYALFRWASGRHAAIGLGVMLWTLVVSLVTDFTGPADAIGGTIVLLFPAVLGAAIRFMRTARLRDLEQVRLKERETIARELHDTVAHHVSAIAIQAQAGRAVAPTRPEAALDALEIIENEASRTLAEMRTMIGALREDSEAELAPQRGVADITRLAGATNGSPNVEVALRGVLDDLTPAVDAALFRIAQESITNARRHARRASTVRVEVQGSVSAVRLSVEDDGDATNGAATDAGFGLVGMAERAKLLGGRFTAGPGATGGWKVFAELPKKEAGT